MKEEQNGRNKETDKKYKTMKKKMKKRGNKKKYKKIKIRKQK